MIHRGKVSQDDDGRWAGVCDCGVIYHNVRWRDAFDSMFGHVRAQRRMRSMGFGFTSGGKRYDR